MKRKAWAILRAFLKSSIVFARSTARSGSNSSEKYSCAAFSRSACVANSFLIPASSPASSQKPAHLGHSSTRTPRFTLWKWRIMISESLGQWMRLLRSGRSLGSRSTSRNFSPADSFTSSTRASSNQSNQIPPHPPAHTSTVTPSDSIVVKVFEHTGHSITRSSLASGSRVVSVIPSSLFRLPLLQFVDQQAGIQHVKCDRPLRDPQVRPSWSSSRENRCPSGKRWYPASRSASSRNPSKASVAPAWANSPRPSSSSSKPSSIRRTNSASEAPSSLALDFSARSCSSLMYNCLLTTYTPYTSQGAVASTLRPAAYACQHGACGASSARLLRRLVSTLGLTPSLVSNASAGFAALAFSFLAVRAPPGPGRGTAVSS